MNTATKSTKNKQIAPHPLFIKKFKTGKQHYIYNVYSNEIIKVSRIIWDKIDLFHKPVHVIVDNLEDKHNKEDILKAYETIMDSRFFNTDGNLFPRIISIKENEAEIKYLFENAGIKQIILDLTNRCNMRCKYCGYSGKYKYERPHQNKNMSKEYAVKAVDYFLKHSSKKEQAAVTFYGGEPLLEFDLFKYIVEYVKSYKRNYVFSLTTNGTLLNEEISKFLIHNDILIDVSFDGPKFIHDKNRVMISGKGSYDLIIKNLKQVKKLDPDYFFSKITYRSVITPPYDSEAITNYFYNSGLFNPLKNLIQVTPVSTYGSSYICKSEISTTKQQYKKNYRKLFSNYKKALISGKYGDLNIEKTWFKDMIELIHFRKKTPLRDHHAASGQCTPGLNRLFVNPDGKFYMCERVGEHFCIGDIDNGLNFKKISTFFTQWVKFFKDCSNCWALRLCRKCFQDVQQDGKFNIKRKKSLCQSTLKTFEMLLIEYCDILEENPDAFKNFKPEDFLPNVKREE